MPMSPRPNYRVYRNLNDGTWTVQTYRPGVGWRKDGSSSVLITKGTTFKVYETGRQRVLIEKRKNVHAYALCDSVMGFSTDEEAGFWYYSNFKKELEYGNGITYNPYKDEYFKWVKGGKCGYSHLTLFNTEGKLINLVEVEPEHENTDSEQPEDN